MNIRFQILAAVFVLALLPCTSVQAQMCDTAFEAIITLHPPRLGVPTVWDATYAQKEGMVQLASGVPKQEGTVMALGRTLAKEQSKPEQIVLAEINRRGRVLKEQMYPVKEAEMPVKMIPLKAGYLAVSNRQGGAKKDRHAVRLAWYGAEGIYRHEKILQDDTYDYDSMGTLAAADEEGFVVIIHAVNHGLENDQHGLLIRFSSDGRELWKRAYRPGIPNQIAGVNALDDGGYLATGRIKLDDGRMAGWVMKLGHDGTVLWQRTYPRGKFSVLRRAAQVPALTTGHEGRGFLVLGDSTPIDGGPDATWLMAVDVLGEPQWQRYFRRPDYELSGFGLMRNEDGRIIVAMNAKAMDGGGHRSHVRMLILSPRGVIVEDESYIEGVQAKGNDFVRGWNGERVVTATIESDSTPVAEDMVGDDFIVAQAVGAADGQKKQEQVSKGWVFVATALDPYNDPCEIKRSSAQQHE